MAYGPMLGQASMKFLLVKKYKLQLSYPIFVIWKNALHFGLIPQILKVQYIALIFKKGEKTGPLTTDQ